MSSPWRRVVSLLLLTGCVAPEPEAPGLEVRTPAQLAVRSAPRLDDNTSGLVTLSTLRRWRDDWAGSRPGGVRGDLVVLQLDQVASPGHYLAPADGVRVYDAADLDMFVEPRSSGLVSVGRVPANGVRVDRLLRAYGARPGVDLVVLAQGEASRQGLETLARTWATLRYWGVPHEALAVLAEPLALVPGDERTDQVAAHPFDGTVRVAGLAVDHAALLADVGAVREASGVSALLDVRPTAQFDGLELTTSPLDASCLEGATRCTAAVAGHVRGARSYPLERMLAADGTLQPPEVLEAVVGALGDADGAPVIVLGAHEGDSAVAFFVLLGVLGVPARWYAPGFVEFGSLVAEHPEPALRLLPSSSPWRTEAFIEGPGRFATAGEGIRPLVFDPAVAATTRVQRSDGDYKADPPALPSPSASIQNCR